ncbi:MAG: nucleotidyltransferase family protein [Desulfuromonadaceae bacterium]|nr:nucleotidyltransferase family protein [Desulfuromonadaceae bacterium]
MKIETMTDKLVPILKQYGASRIGIFGSYARGEATEDSDLDLLVEFSEQHSLLCLVQIRRELSEALGVEVDLLTEASISRHLIDRIKSELRIVYQ